MQDAGEPATALNAADQSGDLQFGRQPAGHFER
jgi:hypothetical protein